MSLNATQILKCWHCGKEGHFRRECKELENNKKQGQVKKNQNWMMKRIDEKAEILLDSGASQHTCGIKSKFSELREIEPEEIMTANGIITFHQIGTINMTLDNGLNVTLNEVAFWPNAPFLISVSKLADKGISVTFMKDFAVIKSNEEILYNAKRNDTVYQIELKPLLRAYISVKIWHQRLNHCGKDKLKLTLDDKVKTKDIEEFYDKPCPGCILGKSHRSKIDKQHPAASTYGPLQLLVADCIGPYPRSIDSKRGALIVGDYQSQFLWCLPFFRKSQTNCAVSRTINNYKN